MLHNWTYVIPWISRRFLIGLEVHTSWNLLTLTAKADIVFCQLGNVSNCLVPLDVQNEIQLLSRVFCYSWLVCLLNFGWEMRRLSKSEIRFFVFHLAGCGLKSLKRFWPYLIAFRSCISRMASLSNYCICVCLFVCLFFLFLISWSRGQFTRLVYAPLY